MKVDVYFDYACPFCYIGLSELAKIMPEFPQIELVWCPAEAHPRPEPQFHISNDPIPNWFARLQQHCQDIGIPLNLPYNPMSYSDLAFQGMHFIHQIDGGDVITYHQNVYRAMFVDGKNLEDIDVLCDCAKSVVKDIEAFKMALEQGVYFQTQLDCNRIAWTEHNLTAVPTLICGDKKLESSLKVGLDKDSIRTFLSSL